MADAANHTIRKITPTGVVTTLAGEAGQAGSSDGTAATARFHYPYGLAVDAAGNVYIADTFNSTIRKVTPRGVVTTLAGQPGQTGSNDGFGSAARFNYPYSVAVDDAGVVYVADTSSSTIRRISPAGAVTTLAGAAGETGEADGGATTARFNCPHGIAVDGAGYLYMADTFNHLIRKIDPKGVVRTLSPSEGGAVAQLGYVESIAVDDDGRVYAVDSRDDSIRVCGSLAAFEGNREEHSKQLRPLPPVRKLRWQMETAASRRRARVAVLPPRPRSRPFQERKSMEPLPMEPPWNGSSILPQKGTRRLGRSS